MRGYFGAQRASERWHGALHVKAIGLGEIEGGTKAELKHEKRMLDQIATELGAILEAFLEFEQQRLYIGALGMGVLARLGRLKWDFGHHAPIEAGPRSGEWLNERVMLAQKGLGVLVKDARIWYHGSKLLAGQVG